MKKLMLIVNPAAGRGGYKNNFGEAMHILHNGGYEVTLYFTAGRGEATALAAEHVREFNAVACVGGDGTLSEVLTGLMQAGVHAPVGYFPMGTANDVATTLGLPKNDMAGAAERIVRGTPHPFDVGGFNGTDYFAYIAAFGAFTEVSYSTPQDQKKALGHLAYVLQGAATLPKIEPIHTYIKYDGGEIETDLLYGSLSNSTSVAGIVRLPEKMVSLGDGVSELVLVKQPETPLDITEMLDSVIFQRFESGNIVILHTKTAEFRFDKPIAWTRDGEDGGMHEQVTLCNYQAPVDLIF